MARLTSLFLAPICANFLFFLHLKHYMLPPTRFALPHYNRSIPITKMYNIHAPLFRSPSPYFAESPQHITSGFALFVYSSIPFLPSFLAFLSPALFAFSLYLATSSYHPPDYFVTCVIMYIASSLLHRILFNEILMYNSRQLYAYHQHLSKYLITTLDWIWMAYHLCT